MENNTKPKAKVIDSDMHVMYHRIASCTLYFVLTLDIIVFLNVRGRVADEYDVVVTSARRHSVYWVVMGCGRAADEPMEKLLSECSRPNYGSQSHDEYKQCGRRNTKTTSVCRVDPISQDRGWCSACVESTSFSDDCRDCGSA